MVNSIYNIVFLRPNYNEKTNILLAILWLGLNAFAKSVQADEYNNCHHVIKENISGNGVDMSVLEAEIISCVSVFFRDDRCY